MSLLTEIQALALKEGHKITLDDADWIIWNRTGYPTFFTSDTPHMELLEQARVYLSGESKCSLCGVLGDTDFGTCDSCLTVGAGRP